MPFPAAPTVWAPKFDVSFIEPLMVTAKELIARDQVAALAWASPDKVLKPFQHVLLGRRDPTFFSDRLKSFPAAVIAPAQTRAPESVAGEYVDESNLIGVELVVFGSDPDALTIDVTRYAKAVDQIWRAASHADLTWNLKEGHYSQVTTDVTQHDYPVIAYDGPNAYLCTVGLQFTAELKEG